MRILHFLLLLTLGQAIRTEKRGGSSYSGSRSSGSRYNSPSINIHSYGGGYGGFEGYGGNYGYGGGYCPYCTINGRCGTQTECSMAVKISLIVGSAFVFMIICICLCICVCKASNSNEEEGY